MKQNRRRAHGLRNVVAGLLAAIAAALPVTVIHAQSVTNTATVTVADGVVDPVLANNTSTATVLVSSVPAYDFCPAGSSPVFSLVNGVEIWRYDAGATADVRVDALSAPVAGNLNGLMVDPVRNRLLFVQRVGNTSSVIWAYDAGNGGWYQAVPAFASPDFPRAAMGPDGVGYLIASGNAPDVWRITGDATPGSFGYAVQRLGSMAYDEPPTDSGSGDIAFDASGAAWLSAGRDLYTIDFSAASPVAVRQVRPLLDGSPATINWAGVAFGADGTLYVANNAATGAYYAYDRTTGTLGRAASTTPGASRDLASCAFPQPAEPELSVAKTLAELNGAPYVAGTPLQPGDVLGYDITLANTGNAVATLYPGDVVETLPQHTTVVAAGNDFSCTGSNCPNTEAVNVPAGDSAVLRFVVEVADPLPTSVTAIANAVAVTDIDCDAAGNDCNESTPVGPVVIVTKVSDVGDATAVAAGQTLTYTVNVTVGNAATTAPVTITDTLGAGLDFGSVTSAGAFACTGELICVLPAGTAPGTWPVTYTATVTSDAVTSVSNTVTTDVGTCSTCSTTNPLLPATTVVKSSQPAAGETVTPGESIAYTLTVTVANAPLAQPLTLVDALGTGLVFGEVTSAGAFTCSGALECVLPAGTAPGTHALTYTATVADDATGAVSNAVTASNPPGGDPDPVCTTCSVEHPVALSSVTVVKSADPAAGSTVLPGATINYTLTVTVADSATTQPLTLADTLGVGLTFGAITDAGAFQCTGALTCVLPAGQLPGTYAVTYSAVVDSDATGSVGNSVVATNPPGGDPDPVCTTCTTEHDISPSTTTVVKTADPADGSTVLPGSTINYTLTVTVADSATTQPLTLADTLGEGLSFGSVTDAGVFQCTGALTCVLPAGQLPGTYAVTYSATVNADATGSVGNVVVATNPPGGDPDPVCTTCATEHEVSPSTTTVVKTAGPADGSTVLPGSTINYTLTVTVADSATTQPLTLTDTLGDGLSFGSVTDAGVFQCTGALTCLLPVGQLPGTYAVTYSATVDADATGSVGNVVVATNPPGGDPDPVCTTCATEHDISPSTTTVVKTADPANGSTVLPGSTINYTLTVTVADSATTQALTLADTLGEGLTFGAITDSGVFQCTGALTCVLPAGQLPGTYAVTYSATVDADATGSVGNSVVGTNPPGGDPDPVCTTCSTEHPIVPAAVEVVKSSDPANGTDVLPGATIAYTLSVTVTNSATTEALTLVDTLGDGLTFGAVTDAGMFQCTAALTCILPAGQLPGTYAVTYTATVDADATGSVGNSVVATNPPGGDPDPVCTTCSTEHPIVPAAVEVVKSSDPASGTDVLPGATIAYTLTVTVTNSATTEALTLVDTLGESLTFAAVTDAGLFQCTGALTCVLPAGQLPGTYAVTYSATVDADATGSVGNSVVATNPPGGDPDPVCTTCSTEHPIVPAAVAVTKSSDPASGTDVLPGATIAYTLAVTVTNSATTEALTLVDTLGEGLTFGAVTEAGVFQCTAALTCILPAGQLPGTYAVTYSATVDADATGSVGNIVVATNPPGGDPDPVCTSCSTEHPIEAVSVVVRKDANPAPGSEVRAGDVVTYTLTAEVRNSVTTEVLRLVDTLGEGLAFGEVLDAGAFTCTGSLECTLPAGTLPGSYGLSYTARVEPGASGELRNVVVATGGSPGTPPECDSCSTTHTLAQPRVSIAKSSNPGSGAEVAVGDTIEYTLEVRVEDAATLADVTLVDTPDAGLAIGTLPAACSLAGGTIRCVVPVGTVPGVYSFVYPATVTADAASSIANVVVGESTGGPAPECSSCATTHELADEAALRITKVVGARDARIGDLVRYTLTVENVGTLNVREGIVLDTPPAGFTYVEDSMTVADGDGAFDLAATRHPLRIGGLDIAVGQRATITYLLRVGAGVRTGVHVNTAVAVDLAGEPVSNTATAQLVIESDPMLDDSLVFGTVFDDRDGDGWQDSGKLGDIRVQGGFEASAYVPGSTTIDRGHGPEPVADASAPLLAGLALGNLAARESVGQPARRIVVRQLLREPAFTGDFVLDTAQGVRVRMEADGSTRVESSGDAARGLNAAAPVVERRVAQVEGGIAVEYVVSSEGVDERGIAGVRIATVEGLLVETDEYGRYHLADIHGGDWARGRNLVLKVDPATLPPGTVFTTDNPLLRRVTPGLPVRFDFGVKLPVREIEGGRRVLELELGDVVFAPGSAVLREEHLPVVERIAARVEEYGGGEVTITATAGDEALAFARAAALRDALQAQLSGPAASALRIVLLTEVDAAAVAGLDGGDTFLGTVLFDTDRADIRPEFASLLDAVAERLDALGGGSVAIVGHTDVRGAHAYNTALGLRRAQAVHRALAERLGPEARAGLRVESSADPTAPVGGTW